MTIFEYIKEKLNPEDYKTYKMAMKNLDKEVQFNDQK